MQKRQQQKLTFKDKIKMLFCAKSIDPKQNSSIMYKRQNERRPLSGGNNIIIKKQQRQTLNINDVFLKLSRKNVVEQEFYSNQILNLQLEKHLASRIKGFAVGIVKGQFTQETTEMLKIPVYLNEKPIKTIPYRQQIKTDSLIKIRKEIVDIILYQTSATCIPNIKKNRLRNQNMKIQNNQNNNNKNNNINQHQTHIIINLDRTAQQQQFKQIFNLLTTYEHTVNNFVIVCSKNIEPLDYSKEMIDLSKEYLFQLERIRQNQELVCNVIYVSRSASFLRLNDKAFKDFIISQMEMTIQEEDKMGEILSLLIQKKYHREIAYTLRMLKKQSFTTRSFFQPFIMKICAQNENIRKIIGQMKKQLFSQQSLDNTPQLVQPTPLFTNNFNHSASHNVFQDSQI